MSDEELGLVIDDPFERGRRDGFKKIIELIDFDATKHAEQIAQDFMIMGRQDGQMNAIEMGTDTSSVVDMALAPAAESFKQYMVQACQAMRDGLPLPELIGPTEDIKYYKHATGGDYDAGVRSAVWDAQMMILTLNTKDMVEATMKNINIPPSITEQIPLRTIQMMTSWGIAVRTDIALSKIERTMRQKHPKPKTIALDGEEPGPMPKWSLLDLWADITDPSNKFAFLRGKVETTWPPFHGEMVSQFDATASIYADDTGKALSEPVMPDNENPEFAEGFRQTLREIYLHFQSSHFELKIGAGGYAVKMAQYGLGNKMMNRSIDDAFGNYRDSLREQMKETAKGEGTTYEDGQAAAQKWAEQKLRQVKLSGSTMRDPNNIRLLKALKTHWHIVLNEHKTGQNTPVMAAEAAAGAAAQPPARQPAP